MTDFMIHPKMTLQDAFAILGKNNSIETIVKTRENADILMGVLTDCDCCFRHTVHRPCHMNDNLWEQHLPIPNGNGGWLQSYRKCKCFYMDSCSFTDNDDCKCPCRHYCRAIQKAFKKQKN